MALDRQTPGILLNIDVDDVDRALAFYADAFGWRSGRRLGPDFAEIVGPNVSIYLLACAGGTVPAPGATPRGYGRHWTPVHFGILVEDLDSALAKAEAAGARREGEPEVHPYGRLVRLADPFGHGCCLLQFLGKGYDEIIERSPCAGRGTARPCSEDGVGGGQSR